MKIDAYLKKDVIIITTEIQKQKLLKYANKKRMLFSCKIYTIEQFKKEYLFSYHEKTIVEIMEKENTTPSIAHIYMKLFYYLEEQEYKNDKIKKLFSLFQYLKKTNSIIEDKDAKKYIQGKEVILYEIENEKEEDIYFLKKISTKEIIKEERNQITHPLYIFDSAEEEIVFIASKIGKLFQKGIKSPRIKVIFQNEEYKSFIKRIFTLYHIPFEIREKKSLLSYDITKYFLFLVENEEDSIEISYLLKENYDLKNPFLKQIYDKLIYILNQYAFISKKNIRKQIIEYACTKETIQKERYQNVVEVKKIYEEDIEKEDFIFIVGSSSSYFPIIHKDDEYISDKEKKELHLTTSYQKNQKEEEKLEKFLNTHDNIIITYAKASSFNTYVESSFVRKQLEKKYFIQKEETPILSKDYASYLLSIKLEDFEKYNKLDEILPILYKNVPNFYKTYQNEFTAIPKEKLHTYLDGKLTLSYTSLETFYKCKFRFYLQNILKIKEENKEEINRIFGNIVHAILEQIENSKNIEKTVDKVINFYFEKENRNAKEKFYIQKYKKEIIRMIDILKNQHSSFKETYKEKEVEKVLDYKNVKVKLVGKIDKVCTYQEKDKTYAVIVDYKTGNTKLDIQNIHYGLGMQLFLYYYLLKEENLSFAGVYLQNIISDILKAKKDTTYEKLLWEAYQLNGYTLKNKEIVEKIDDKDNSHIKSIRIKKDGDFYHNAKVLEEKEVEKILEIIKENVEKAVKQIYDASFTINPKNIGVEKEIVGCKYCPYQDICFKKEKDIKILPKQNIDIEKGDKDE